MTRRLTRRALDSWFPTLARYFGLGVLGYAVFFDRGRNPALIPGAMGLIFLKTAINGGSGS